MKYSQLSTIHYPLSTASRPLPAELPLLWRGLGHFPLLHTFPQMGAYLVAGIRTLRLVLRPVCLFSVMAQRASPFPVTVHGRRGTGPFFGRLSQLPQTTFVRKHGPVPFLSAPVNGYPFPLIQYIDSPKSPFPHSDLVRVGIRREWFGRRYRTPDAVRSRPYRSPIPGQAGSRRGSAAWSYQHPPGFGCVNLKIPHGDPHGVHIRPRSHQVPQPLNRLIAEKGIPVRIIISRRLGIGVTAVGCRIAIAAGTRMRLRRRRSAARMRRVPAAIA